MSDYTPLRGKLPILSVGPITFGPENILFLADIIGAELFAISVDPGRDNRNAPPLELAYLDEKIGEFLECEPEFFTLRDMAVHPLTENVFISLSRGRGREAIPYVIRIDKASGEFDLIDFNDIAYSHRPIENAPDETQQYRGFKMRSATVSDMAYIDGTLFVAGMSNEEFSSAMRRYCFPFDQTEVSNSLEIFHVSHGLYETAAPIRTFIPYQEETAAESINILASYTCTPLVKFSLSEMANGLQAKGKTVAELGARNAPIDMISVAKGDDQYVLVSNTSHPFMKINTKDIEQQDGLTTPQSPTGVGFESLPQQGVSKLGKFGNDYILMLQQDAEGGRHLKSLATSEI